MTTIRARIGEYLSSKGISDYLFEQQMGLSKGYMARCKNPTSEVLEKLCSIYTDISCEWLLRDTGNMTISDSPDKLVLATPDTERLTALFTQLISERDEKIRSLESELITLKSSIK